MKQKSKKDNVDINSSDNQFISVGQSQITNNNQDNQQGCC